MKIQGYETIKNDRSTGARDRVALLVKYGLAIIKEYRNIDFNIQGRRRRSGRLGHDRTRMRHIPIKLNSLLSRNNENDRLKLNSQTRF